MLAAFSAPFLDFAGLWGAHLAPGLGKFFGALAVCGGFAMGICFVVVFAVTIAQLWLLSEENSHA